jgi:hypothetical protein
MGSYIYLRRHLVGVVTNIIHVREICILTYDPNTIRKDEK